MAVRLNCGEVQPYASMWGPTDLGRMTEASTITEIHQNPTAWDTKIEADTAEGKKYMFCALTSAELMMVQWIVRITQSTLQVSRRGIALSTMP